MNRLLSAINRAHKELFGDVPLVTNPPSNKMSQQETLDSLLDGISEELGKLKSYGVRVPDMSVDGSEIILLDRALSFYSAVVLEGLARTYTGTAEKTGETIIPLISHSCLNSDLHALFYAKAITRVYGPSRIEGEGHINLHYGNSRKRQKIFAGFAKIAGLTREIKAILEKRLEERFSDDKGKSQLEEYKAEVENVVNYFCVFLKHKYFEARETLREDRAYYGAEKREIGQFNFLLGKIADDLRGAFGYSSATSGTPQEDQPRRKIDWGRASYRIGQLLLTINEDSLEKNHPTVKTTLARSLKDEVANLLVYARFLEAAASHYRSLIRIPDYR